VIGNSQEIVDLLADITSRRAWQQESVKTFPKGFKKISIVQFL